MRTKLACKLRSNSRKVPLKKINDTRNSVLYIQYCISIQYRYLSLIYSTAEVKNWCYKKIANICGTQISCTHKFASF